MVITLGKIVRKWRPDDYWRIGEHESWFSDMALEGLHLKDIGYRIAKFEKGEPKKTRYRIDIYQGEHTDKEQKEFYGESGWDFVTNYGEFNIYASPTELNAPELHSDPVEQSYTLKTIENNMSALFFVSAMGPIIMVVLLYFILFRDSTLSLGLLNNFAMRAVIIFIIGSRGLYDSTRSLLAIRSLRKDLLAGKPIDHNAPWREKHRRSKTISRTLFIISLLVLIFPLISIIKSETKTLPLTSGNLPIVRLTEIEQNPELIIDISDVDDKINYANYYEYTWNLLAPIIYESQQRGIVPNEVWEEDGSPYDPFVTTNTYKLAIPDMSQGVFNGLIKKSKVNSNGEFLQVENPNFDNLVIYNEKRFTEVFAYKGAGVIRVRYIGKSNVEDIIKAIEEKMVLIEN